MAVGAERLDVRGRGCGRAQPRVAVDVRRADPRIGQTRNGVVVLEEELTAVVEADGARAVTLLELSRPGDNEVHGLVPCRLRQLAVAADEGSGKSIDAVVRLPAVQPFGAESTVVDAVDRATADPHDLPIADTDIQRAAVGAQHASRLDPTLGLRRRVLVHPNGPLAHVRRPRSPDVGDRVARLYYR